MRFTGHIEILPGRGTSRVIIKYPNSIGYIYSVTSGVAEEVCARLNQKHRNLGKIATYVKNMAFEVEKRTPLVLSATTKIEKKKDEQLSLFD